MFVILNFYINFGYKLNLNTMKKQTKQNTYFPFRPNVEYLKRKWMNKICAEDKGGSFNETLYKDYLDAILNYTK